MGYRRSLLAVLAVLCASAVMAPPALAAPSATTGGVTELEGFRARVHGNVSDPSTGMAVQYYFEWGTTASYGSKTSTEWDYGANGGAVSRLVEPLSQGTLYHYRVVAIDQGGVKTEGEDKTFTTPAPPNRDGDAYPDNSDSCPDTPGGPAGQYNAPGCPAPGDSDGDGIIDPEDPCPTQSGGSQGPYNQRGCPPPPDPDGDGIADPSDGCPTQSGPGNAGGCPLPDADGDGVADSQDYCPSQPGVPPGSSTPPGCPVDKDKDKDGIEEADDKCPEHGHVYATDDEGQYTNEILRKVRPAGHKYAGCLQMTPFWYALRGWKGFPTMKDFLKKQQFTWAMICPGACKITQTISFDAATTKKLKLKSPVIDSMSDSAPCGASGQCTSGYMFNPGPNYEIPAAIKKQLAKLKTVTILLTVNLTDDTPGATRGEKSKWGSRFVVGSKKKPAQLAEL